MEVLAEYAEKNNIYRDLNNRIESVRVCVC